MVTLEKQAVKKIHIVFVLALFTLFATVSFSLVLIGAKQYRFVTQEMEQNYSDRTAASYLAEKIRQNDRKNAITITCLEGVPALSIATTEQDSTYFTYIYYYGESLRELVVTQNSVFSLSGGQAILPVQGFEPMLLSENLLCTDITDTIGETKRYYFTLHSSSQTN